MPTAGTSRRNSSGTAFRRYADRAVSSCLSPRYLIRFDDLCPTMNWSVWDDVERILIESSVKPILAVVPDNKDPYLVVAPALSSFWDRVRDWSTRGWRIGIHGYQHLYETASSGIIGTNARSEFSGLPYSLQRERIEQALKKFRQEGINPDLWVAPAHSFDLNTLAALRDCGIRAVSDGYYFRPVRDPFGLVWIPQQLWRFRRVPFGTWTVCYHVNAWSRADVHKFRDDIVGYKDMLVSADDVINTTAAPLAFMDTAFAACYSRVLRARIARR